MRNHLSKLKKQGKFRVRVPRNSHFETNDTRSDIRQLKVYSPNERKQSFLSFCSNFRPFLQPILAAFSLLEHFMAIQLYGKLWITIDQTKCTKLQAWSLQTWRAVLIGIRDTEICLILNHPREGTAFIWLSWSFDLELHSEQRCILVVEFVQSTDSE